MLITITGKPGSGKTTFLRNILTFLGSGIGFYTEEIRSGRSREGFIAITSWNDEVLLAHRKLKSPFRVGRYGVNIPEFEDRVVKKLEDLLENHDLIYLDEVGKMELMSERFRELVKSVLEVESGKLVLLTIPFKNIDPLIEEIKRKSRKEFRLPEWRDEEKKALHVIESILK